MTEQFEEDPELDELLHRAESGDASAMLELGDMCVAENLTGQAQDWYRQAAEGGEPGGYRGLGQIATAFGQHADAVQWWLKGVEHNDLESFFLVGTRMVVDRANFGRQGFEILEKGFEAGHIPCGAELGAAYLLVREPDEARKWLTAATIERDPNAARTLAAMVEAGGDLAAALELHRFAADLGVFESLVRADQIDHWRTDDPEKLFELASSGDVASMVTIGRNAIEGGDFQGGVEWLGDAVDQGSIAALTSLGEGFADHSDFAEAEHWYRQSAEQGDRIGTYRLGQLLMNEGRFEEALEILEPAQHPELLVLVSELWEMEDDMQQAESAHERLTEMVAQVPIPRFLDGSDSQQATDQPPPQLS